MNIKVGLLLNSNQKLCSYSVKFQNILINNHIPHILIDWNSKSFLEEIKMCTHLLFRHSQGDTDKIMFESIFNIIQNIYNINCWPNFQTYWPYEDKIKEFYLLKSNGFPIIDSRIFWSKSEASNFLKETKFPIVGKLSKGASSSNVVLINSLDEGKRIVNQIFIKGVKSHGLKINSNLSSFKKVGLIKYSKKIIKSILIFLKILKDKTEYPEWQLQKDAIIFQKFLPNNEFDTRVTIIGKRAFAYRRFVRKNDFRASGSGNFDTNPDQINKACLQIAFDVVNKLNFNTMAFDFIKDNDGKPYINEISYCFVDWMVESCPGFWDEYLNWHNIQKSPQYYQLLDFLKIDLKS